MTEADLDHAFADALECNPALQTWLVSGGRFDRYAGACRLLRDEQAAARKARHWWKHWWCALPDRTQGETDIFAVFETDHGGRFAIHIENKPSHGLLKFQQAADYRRRATFKANTPKWLNYSDFEVILMAPSAFLASHVECLNQFDRGISYESVSEFVPLFEEAVRRSACSDTGSAPVNA